VTVEVGVESQSGGDEDAGSDADANRIEQELSGVKQVLASGDVRRIVCVDDAYNDAGVADRDAIIAAVEGGDVPPELFRTVALEVLMQRGDDESSYLVDDDDPSSQAQWLRENRDNVEDQLWSRLAEAAPEKRSDAITARDTETLQQLRDFAASVGVEFVPLNLSGWHETGDEVIRGDGCTLIFFDRNLSADGGSDNEGETLLTEAVRKHSPENVIAVLFTHAVTASEEYSRWLAIGGSDPVLRDRVLVIAKDRMREDRLGFAAELKMAILAPRLRRIAALVSKGFVELADQAADKVLRLSPHMLHSILVTSVEKEGAWGPDGLVAIASAYLRRGLEGYVRADQVVWSDALRIRELSLKSREIVLPSGEADEYRNINRVRMFHESDHVNELRLPIDTGDVFAFFSLNEPIAQNPSSFWILVLQRCDVTVRGDGRRGYDPKLMPLAHVIKPSETEHSAGAASIGRIRLHSSPLIENLATEINLQDRVFVPSVALDSCALNKDGISRLSMSAELESDGLIPAWVELANRHRRWGKKKLDAYRQMQATLGERPDSRVLSAISSALTGVGKEAAGFGSKIDLENDQILFGIRRVARLLEPHSQDLMERLGALSSRIPLDVVLEESR
jgi:hypothetical protein